MTPTIISISRAATLSMVFSLALSSFSFAQVVPGEAADPGLAGAAGARIQSFAATAQNGATDIAEAARVGAEALAGALAAETASVLKANPAAAAATAQPSPVVIELFTSQGCSSCPPADELLAQIAPRQDIIALALHVDYWDYLGWEDPFAQPAFTARQKAYARAAGERMIYTPQMIIGGSETLVGPSAEALEAAIASQASVKQPVAMTISGGGGQYEIELHADPPLEQGTIVQIVRYAPQARVEILRGENAGLEMDYANVVTAWHAVAEWDGRKPTRLTAKIQGEEPAVVIVQSARPSKSAPLPGTILAAGRLN
ncbi:DUF1223 domain-containing protein [Sedimentimonas flavescens]|uniref:DUF1223 domain-containing protein n=1 Tax=Sedimentimonas flavescens TaxID=2851012 RepID=A0ABT2ZYE4_9RHOB|nr:DUF1223 domain-containing protein [Sedimentimonas flavescens]MCT2540705.1 DUF1223 domain-containing protein [Sedimentimonas flavescens]MCV2878668.1 DUF1223 domain-containing protein [Sedimentimonas flavescens]